MVMPRNLKIHLPAMANVSSTPAMTPQASRAMRMRDSGESCGVMAMNAGTVASGSTITNNELAASRIYSERLMVRRQNPLDRHNGRYVSVRCNFAKRECPLDIEPSLNALGENDEMTND